MEYNLITLAGCGSRFRVGGFDLHKHLIPVDGVPMEIKSANCLPKSDNYVFVCRKDHVDEYQIDSLLKRQYFGCEIVVVDDTTDGQACTAEMGILESSIKSTDTVLISSCDYGISWNLQKYKTIKDNSDVVVWLSLIHI